MMVSETGQIIHPQPQNRIPVQVASLKHRIRPHRGLDLRVLAVALHKHLGGAVGLGSVCEIATEKQEQDEGDHRQEHRQAMLA